MQLAGKDAVWGGHLGSPEPLKRAKIFLETISRGLSDPKTGLERAKGDLVFNPSPEKWIGEKGIIPKQIISFL